MLVFAQILATVQTVDVQLKIAMCDHLDLQTLHGSREKVNQAFL